MESLKLNSSEAEVARWLQVAPKVVFKVWNQFQTRNLTGNDSQARHRATTPAEDRYLSLSARWHRVDCIFSTYSWPASGIRISWQIVYKRLAEKALYFRRPVECVRLSESNRKPRLLWYRIHESWAQLEWRSVLSCDESKFTTLKVLVKSSSGKSKKLAIIPPK